ncbi:hypothetical protein LXA43DRAFT_130544 [Ganoderma leucocontextum]|nr:hypothetical protein LXA43DRAFT_130544 [Ganoderma leucocontextum]
MLAWESLLLPPPSPNVSPRPSRVRRGVPHSLVERCAELACSYRVEFSCRDPSCFKHVGVGIICSVAYFDPGNWSVDLQAGSLFGYRPMLFVILMAGLGAMVLQSLSFTLGCVTGLDLASHCRVLLHDRPRHRRLIRWSPISTLCTLRNRHSQHRSCRIAWLGDRPVPTVSSSSALGRRVDNCIRRLDILDHRGSFSWSWTTR